MKKSDYHIHIVGAGISGLIAALVLERHGYAPIMLESSDRVGGRLKTDHYVEHVLDHGFQVLLTAYPMAKKYLDYKALELCYFKPGAILFQHGKSSLIGDPLRDFSLFPPTLTSSVATLADKIKIFRLNRVLKAKSLEDIFGESETTTLDFLKSYGFSERVIDSFFRPFFSGIFLEPELETSSRMFQFVYKMFGEGMAAIPKNGIEEIPKQLKANLNATQFLFNTPVKTVQDGKILLEDGQCLQSDITIIATDAHQLLTNLKNQETLWQSCDNIYFETSQKVIRKPLIGLISDDSTLVNNVVYPATLSESNGKNQLLSVTVVKDHKLSPKELVEKVREELSVHLNIENLRFIKHYRIPKALPKLSNLKMTMEPTETRLTSTIYLAGDTLLNASLNAAMLSGEKAAEGVIQLLEESPDLAQFTSEYL